MHDLQFWYGKIPSIGLAIFCFAPQLGHGWTARFSLLLVVSDVIFTFASSSSHEEYMRCKGESPFNHISLNMLRISFFSRFPHFGQSAGSPICCTKFTRKTICRLRLIIFRCFIAAQRLIYNSNFEANTLYRDKRVKLKPGEELLINEGKTGWGTTLALTNKRLLILDKEKVIAETPIKNISGAYAETQILANLTQLKIKLKDGKEMTVIFRSSINGHLYGGSGSGNTDIIDLTNRYVEAINRAVSEKLSAAEV